MKQLFLAATLMIASTSFSQIQVQTVSPTHVVGKCKNGASIQAELSYTINDADTLYRFTFNNAEFKTLDDYKTISFSNEGNTVEALYGLMKSMFQDDKPKDHTINFQLGKENVKLVKQKNFGVTSVALMARNGWVYL